MDIQQDLIEDVVFKLHRQAAIILPKDVKKGIQKAYEKESKKIPKYALGKVLENLQIAEEKKFPVCGDTGLPRMYVKVGNEAVIEGGIVALEGSARKATARATAEIPLRPNAVHPFTRENPNNNVGFRSPDIEYTFEPDADWLEITVIQKGGIFGSDYRMLFPVDGKKGIKKFFLDTAAEFNRRGLACAPAVIGLGVGGTKAQCMKIGKEAACLRQVGNHHPDKEIAAFEEELLELVNSAGFGAMGCFGDISALDVHIEIANCHPGTLPVGMHHQCAAFRRASARINADCTVEQMPHPRWFTPYLRREGL